MQRRTFLRSTAGLAAAALLPKRASLPLAVVRETINQHLERLLDAAGPYGSYRSGVGKRPDFYAACDVAQMRAVMGEDLAQTLTERQRTEWVGHLNSFANRYRRDGSYEDTFGHSPLHANGMVIGALGVLGGKQAFPNRLYEPFDTPEKAAPWLETIDWAAQWTASHLFWGGMHCFSLSHTCTEAWREAVFAWLDANLDERTGWWRKGVPHADRHQPLGGSVHILPVYEHHGRTFPYPERLVDSVLALQLPNGRWLQTTDVNRMSYLELDALYALKFAGRQVPHYRRDAVQRAVGRYAEGVLAYWQTHRDALLALHPHYLLAAVGTFGLLQHFLPEQFPDTRPWSDIFSDRRFYRTDAVEVFH